eukprot:Rmarinus@m.13058
MDSSVDIDEVSGLIAQYTDGKHLDMEHGRDPAMQNFSDRLEKLQDTSNASMQAEDVLALKARFSKLKGCESAPPKPTVDNVDPLSYLGDDSHENISDDFDLDLDPTEEKQIAELLRATQDEVNLARAQSTPKEESESPTLDVDGLDLKKLSEMPAEESWPKMLPDGSMRVLEIAWDESEAKTFFRETQQPSQSFHVSHGMTRNSNSQGSPQDTCHYCTYDGGDTKMARALATRPYTVVALHQPVVIETGKGTIRHLRAGSTWIQQMCFTRPAKNSNKLKSDVNGSSCSGGIGGGGDCSIGGSSSGLRVVTGSAQGHGLAVASSYRVRSGACFMRDLINTQQKSSRDDLPVVPLVLLSIPM